MNTVVKHLTPNVSHLILHTNKDDKLSSCSYINQRAVVAPSAPSCFLSTPSAHVPVEINDMAKNNNKKLLTAPADTPDRQEGKHRDTAANILSESHM